jgi:acetyl esterase
VVGLDTDRLAIGGDSAGGNTAAAVALQCVRENGPALRLQLLAYPATVVGGEHASREENRAGYLLTAETMDWIEQLLPANFDPHDGWISPGRAADVSRLPPAVVITAGFDPIRDDGLAYAAKLRAGGVPVHLLHYPGQFHGFLNFDTVLVAARDGLRRAAASLRSAFDGEAPIDGTVEVGDPPSRHLGVVRRVASRSATATLMGWRAVEAWTDTLARLAAPRLATVAGAFLRPLLRPARWARSAMTARLHPLHAACTYPDSDDAKAMER